jgi:hypothetical protein
MTAARQPQALSTFLDDQAGAWRLPQRRAFGARSLSLCPKRIIVHYPARMVIDSPLNSLPYAGHSVGAFTYHRPVRLPGPTIIS